MNISIALSTVIILALACYFLCFRPLGRKAAAKKARELAEQKRLHEEEKLAKYLADVERFPSRFREVEARCLPLLNARQKTASIGWAKTRFASARNAFEHGNIIHAIIYLSWANSCLNDAEEFARCQTNRIQSENMLLK